MSPYRPSARCSPAPWSPPRLPILSLSRHGQKPLPPRPASLRRPLASRPLRRWWSGLPCQLPSVPPHPASRLHQPGKASTGPLEPASQRAPNKLVARTDSRSRLLDYHCRSQAAAVTWFGPVRSRAELEWFVSWSPVAQQLGFLLQFRPPRLLNMRSIIRRRVIT